MDNEGIALAREKYFFGSNAVGGYTISTGHRAPSSRDILEALNITAYNRKDEDGNKWVDVSAFEQDVRDALKLKRERAERKKQKKATKRLAALVVSA